MQDADTGPGGRVDPRSQDGQLLPLVAAVMVLVGLLALGVGRLGAAVIGRARAQAAADAAALAGAMWGREAARSFAADNGAQVVRYDEVGHEGVEGGPTEVRVEVQVPGGQVAVAQAARVPGVGGRGGSGPAGASAPALRAVLARTAYVLGTPVPVLQTGGGGLTVRVPPELVGRLAAISGDSGLCPEPAVGAAWFGICGPTDPPAG